METWPMGWINYLIKYVVGQLHTHTRDTKTSMTTRNKETGGDRQAAAASSQRNSTTRDKHLVHWFRKGLRLHDNPSLREGLNGCSTYRCIFIVDPWFAGSSNVDINKWRFLLESLDDLDQSLRKLNSRLFVIRGQPAGVLPKLFQVS